MSIPFKPTPASTTKLTAGVTTSSTPITGAVTGADYNVRIHNSGLVSIALEFGDSTVKASLTASLIIPAGGVEVLTAPKGTTHFAAITGSSTADVYVTPGDGI